jgi:hypothetical protein
MCLRRRTLLNPLLSVVAFVLRRWPLGGGEVDRFFWPLCFFFLRTEDPFCPWLEGELVELGEIARVERFCSALVCPLPDG